MNNARQSVMAWAEYLGAAVTAICLMAAGIWGGDAVLDLGLSVQSKAMLAVGHAGGWLLGYQSGKDMALKRIRRILDCPRDEDIVNNAP